MFSHNYIVPLYKGQGGCGSYSEASLQGTSCGWLIWWSLSTRDKLWVAHTVEPLYKGQVVGGSYGGASLQGISSYGGASLQGTSCGWLIWWSLSTRDELWVAHTVKHLYKGRVVGGSYSEASLQGTSCGFLPGMYLTFLLVHFQSVHSPSLDVLACTVTTPM